MVSNSFYENQEQTENVEIRSLTPEKEKRGSSKKILIFLFAIASLGCIATGIYFDFFDSLFRKKQIAPIPTPTSTPYIQISPLPTLYLYSAPPAPSPSLGFALIQLAYIKDNDIWLTKADGKDKIKLPKESHLISFFILNFKDKENLSYTKCSTSCGIYTYNPETNLETLLVEPPTTTGYTRIEAFGQPPSGDYIAFFYTPPDGKTYLTLKTPLSTTVLKELGETRRKGKNLNDQIEIQFSENGEKFLIVNNTLESKESPTIYLFDKNGEEVDTKKSKEFQKADFPIFFDEKGETIIYKYDELLYKTSFTKVTKKGKESIQVKTEKLTSLKDSFELSLSPNKQKLAYFVYTKEKKIELFTYDFENDLHEKIADDLKNPQWLDDQHLLAEKISYCQEGENCNNFGFKKIGLSIIDLKTKKITDLILEENILTFAISP